MCRKNLLETQYKEHTGKFMLRMKFTLKLFNKKPAPISTKNGHKSKTNNKKNERREIISYKN
jgi:hypothetical protein